MKTVISAIVTLTQLGLVWMMFYHHGFTLVTFSILFVSFLMMAVFNTLLSMGNRIIANQEELKKLSTTNLEVQLETTKLLLAVFKPSTVND
jgi:hypothetical protein